MPFCWRCSTKSQRKRVKIYWVLGPNQYVQSLRAKHAYKLGKAKFRTNPQKFKFQCLTCSGEFQIGARTFYRAQAAVPCPLCRKNNKVTRTSIISAKGLKKTVKEPPKKLKNRVITLDSDKKICIPEKAALFAQCKSLEDLKHYAATHKSPYLNFIFKKMKENKPQKNGEGHHIITIQMGGAGWAMEHHSAIFQIFNINLALPSVVPWPHGSAFPAG